MIAMNFGLALKVAVSKSTPVTGTRAATGLPRRVTMSDSRSASFA